MSNFQPRPLEEGFETEYAKDLVAVDTLWGGDIGIPGAEARFIADAYPDPETEVQLPAVYNDEQVAALRKDNAEPDDAKKLSADARAELIKDIVRRYNLLDIPGRLTETLGSDTPPLRRRFVGNMGRCLDVMARLAASGADKQVAPPSFEERYRASTHQEPELIDTVELREGLRAALANVGLEVTTSRNLQETAAAYTQKVGVVSPEEFESEVARVTRELMTHVRSNIFEKLNFGEGDAGEHLEHVPFDGMIFKAFNKPDSHVSGSSCYLGGLTPDGRPAFKDLVEFNAGHPITRPGIYHLCAHEMKPGHYIDSVLSDLGWRSGRLGFEAAVHTMCTAETVAREGWAQVAISVAFGGSEQAVVDALGPEHAVEFAIDRLVDAGKHNGPILVQRDGKSIDDAKKHFAEDCVQPPLYVRKLAAWSRHPILGSMYAPGYAVGHDVLRRSIDQHGALKVAEVALHQKGYQDIDTFQKALEEE